MRAGLWGADEETFGPALAAAAAEDYSSSLAGGDQNRARLLLRLCAAMTTTNVLQTASVLTALDGIVQSAVTVARQGEPAHGDRAGLTVRCSSSTRDLVVFLHLFEPQNGGKLQAG